MAADKDRPGLGRRILGQAGEVAADQAADFIADVALGWIPFGPLAAKLAMAAGKVAYGVYQDGGDPSVQMPAPELNLEFAPKAYKARVKGDEKRFYCVAAPLQGIAPTDLDGAERCLREFRNALPDDVFTAEDKTKFNLRQTGTHNGTRPATGWEITSGSSDARTVIGSEKMSEAQTAANNINHILHPTRKRTASGGVDESRVEILGTYMADPPQSNRRPPILARIDDGPRPLVPQATPQSTARQKINSRDMQRQLTITMGYPSIGAQAHKQRGGESIVPSDNLAKRLENEVITKIVDAHNEGDNFGAWADVSIVVSRLVSRYDTLVKTGVLTTEGFLRERYSKDYPGSTPAENMARQFVADVYQAVDRAQHQGRGGPRTS